MSIFKSLFGGGTPSAAEPVAPPRVRNEAKPVALMPTNQEQMLRHIMRVSRLHLALKKAVDQNQGIARINSLRAELEARTAACKAKGLSLPDTVEGLERLAKEYS